MRWEDSLGLFGWAYSNYKGHYKREKCPDRAEVRELLSLGMEGEAQELRLQAASTDGQR